MGENEKVGGQKILVFSHGVWLEVEKWRDEKKNCLVEKKNQMIEKVNCTLIPLLNKKNTIFFG